MAVSPAVNQNYGGTAVFATSSFSIELTDWDYPGATREAIETTHLGTTNATTNQIGNRTFMPNDLVDAGEVTLSGHFNPDKCPPIHAAAETITLDFTGSENDATWAFSGFITGYSWGAPLNDKMTCDLTIKITGPITVTADS